MVEQQRSSKRCSLLKQDFERNYIFMSLPGDQLIRFALYRRFRYKKSNKKFLISLYFIVAGIGQNNACVNIFVMKFHYLDQNLQINMNWQNCECAKIY